LKVNQSENARKPLWFNYNALAAAKTNHSAVVCFLHKKKRKEKECWDIRLYLKNPTDWTSAWRRKVSKCAHRDKWIFRSSRVWSRYYALYCLL